MRDEAYGSRGLRVFHRLDAFLRRQPAAALTGTGLALVAVLGVLDYTTGPDLSFLIFYVGPVALLAWYAGRVAALLGSLLSAAFWTFEDVLSAHAYASRGVAVWNVAVRLAFFVLFVQTLSQLKLALEMESLAEARRMEREVEIAQAVQVRLFPQASPVAAGVDCHGLCRPARGVAGDYYDFFRMGAGEIGIAVGDVAGKGISAALLMASLQASLRSYVSVNRDGVKTVARELNRQLYALTEPSRFATLFWGIFDEGKRTLTYANAGHNPPFLLRAVFRVSGGAAGRASRAERLSAGGLPLGLFGASAYQDATAELEPGDLLAFYTDGITEASNAREETFGDARLESVLRENAHRPASELCRIVVESVDAYREGAPQTDDMTIVIARILAF
jgi:serine phosphatase RsbU (regulator of sigma subunit)